MVLPAATHMIAIRHGETAWNVGGRLQGQTDIELNAKGLEQARLLAQRLGQERLDAIYSSDLLRAYQTAAEVARMHDGLEISQLPGLRERHFGYYQGRTFAQIQEVCPQDAQRWQARDPDFTPGETGESLRVFRSRIVETLDGLAMRHQGQTVVVVTHGGVLDMLYRYASDVDLRAPRTWQIDNTSLSRLVWTASGVKILSWADTHHLQAGKGCGFLKGTLADL